MITGPNRRNQVITVVVGLIIAAAGVAGVLIYARSGTSPSTQTVVVASADISVGTQLGNANLTTADVSSNAIPQGAFTSIDQVAGQYATATINKQLVIAPALVSTTPPAPGPTQSATTGPLSLPSGDVAIAVTVDSVTSVGGYLVRGSHVDIIIGSANAQGIRYIIQDSPILEVGSLGHSGIPDLVVLDVSRSDAQLLGALTDPGSAYHIVRFVVRSQLQYGQAGHPNLLPTDPPLSAGPGSQLP